MNKDRFPVKSTALSFLCAILLAGCAATPVPRALTPALSPEKFEGPVAEGATAWPQAGWWQGFGDPALTALIADAQANNPDIAVAAARVLEAEARAKVQGAALLPQVNAGASGTDCTSGGFSCSNFGLNLSASYEADFWGLARANLRAAQEQLKSARFARQAAALTVTANVAERYFELLAIRRQIAIANENMAAINTILDVVQVKVKAGSASRLDLARELAQVEQVQASLPGLQTQEKQTLYALAVLLGRVPQGFTVAGQNLDGVTAPKVAPGLPAELLLRRPDVAGAEADLAAAHANVDAARAAFFPAISLSASGSFASAAIGTLLQGSNFGASYGASLLQSIFDGGALAGRRDLARATEQEYVAHYRSAALNAYADVETALTQFANTGTAELHLRRQIDAAREAFEITQLQYRQGATDLINVLQAQQTLFGAEGQLVQITLSNREAAVHLFEALGGGWEEAPEDRTQPAAAASAASPPP
jgi:NodT family efflux transporter outer membrane factor (OMF) lipoprotein